MKRLTLLVLALVAACDAAKPPYAHYEPPDWSIEDASSSSEGPECEAYLGCLDACPPTGMCAEQCAEATDAPVETCEDIRCSDLIAACSDGDAVACADLPSCASAHRMPTDAGSSSESEG